MARRPGVLRAQPCALAAAAALALACALYYAGSGPSQRAPPPPPPPPSPSAAAAAAPAPESKAKAGEEEAEEALRAEAEELHVVAVLAKAERNEALREKAAAALRSLVRFGKLGPREALALHLLCDGPSRGAARQLLQQALRPAAFKYKVVFHDLETLAQKLQPTVEALQKLFSAGAGSYYGDSLFFLSVAMHHIMPREVSRVIQVDLDVEYRANIRELFQEFDNFPEGAVIGIAQEMQPVYRSPGKNVGLCKKEASLNGGQLPGRKRRRRRGGHVSPDKEPPTASPLVRSLALLSCCRRLSCRSWDGHKRSFCCP
ncbi:xyloside xylosyltransferase 1 isoform X2 [Thamnophis elegans]|uniref:xyloside xylosyltransferase 1 isoform X2 n=1 Tax=Thamnophis elegans TaxID=35005 RepID=UPI001377ACA1|nr:xyloside xylosyltransferase 1 isoform X2 [Thamnophis elegans]